jgi:predicted nucleic acid-binding Zn ribbon protein
VTRVLHPVAVHFKGSGFYSTDYGRRGRKPSRDGEKPDSGGEKKKEETKAPAGDSS